MRALAFLLCLGPTAHASQLKLHPVENGRTAQNLDAELLRDREAVGRDPRNRGARLRLIADLRRAGRFEEALREAQAWRAIDAYNLVVVRLIGDLNADLGRKDAARRAYSAVVELVPNDAAAQRALATVLKQTGDLEGAYGRLAEAERLKPDDRRIAFELADTAHRLGRSDEARGRFEKLAGGSDQVAYPAQQRLRQIQRLEKNDIKIYLTWDTDKSDVDLWVTTPSGEKVFYRNKIGSAGESLHDDVTTGYGPESFTAHHAQAGTYTVEVNYYSGGRGEFAEARGEVVVLLHEGQPDEERHVLPYRVIDRGQTVTVGRIQVGGAR